MMTAISIISNRNKPLQRLRLVGNDSVNRKVSKVFPTYLELELGGITKDEYIKAIESLGMSLSDMAKELMNNRRDWRPGRSELAQFSCVSIQALGFEDTAKPPTTKQVFSRIRALGHTLCKPADGPALLLALPNHPRGDALWVAMNVIVNKCDSPHVFRIVQDENGNRRLLGFWARSVSLWDLSRKVIFRIGT